MYHKLSIYGPKKVGTPLKRAKKMPFAAHHHHTGVVIGSGKFAHFTSQRFSRHQYITYAVRRSRTAEVRLDCPSQQFQTEWLFFVTVLTPSRTSSSHILTLWLQFTIVVPSHMLCQACQLNHSPVTPLSPSPFISSADF